MDGCSGTKVCACGTLSRSGTAPLLASLPPCYHLISELLFFEVLFGEGRHFDGDFSLKLLDTLSDETHSYFGGVGLWSFHFGRGPFSIYADRELLAARLRERERLRRGERILPGGDMHEEHLKFVAWAKQYDEGLAGGRSLPRHEAWIARQSCPVLRIEGDLSPSDA